MPVLTEKQNQFVKEYVVDWNGTQAYIRAGYAGGNRNSVARTESSRLLANPNIQEAIAVEKARIARSKAITVEEIADGLRREAMAFGAEGELQTVPSSARVQAWVNLGKLAGFFVEKTQTLSVSVDQEQVQQALSEFSVEELKEFASSRGKTHELKPTVSVDGEDVTASSQQL